MELLKYTQLYHLQRAAVMADQSPAPSGTFFRHGMVYLDTTKPGSTKLTQLQFTLHHPIGKGTASGISGC